MNCQGNGADFHAEPDAMDAIFRFIRAIFLPSPLILWTLLWPVWAMVILILVVPVRLASTTAGRFMGLPFVFFGAALSGNKKSLPEYFSEWETSYKQTGTLLETLDFASGYESIFKWWAEPKSVETGGWIIACNAISGIGVLVVASELVRTILGYAIAGLIILLVLGLISD